MSNQLKQGCQMSPKWFSILATEFSCSINLLCRHGIQLNPGSDIQRLPEKNLGPRICRKYLGVQTWRVKKEKNKERKERQTGVRNKKSIIYSGLKTTTCLITY